MDCSGDIEEYCRRVVVAGVVMGIKKGRRKREGEEAFEE